MMATLADLFKRRYCEQANMMKLADNAAGKLISGTKIVSVADPLRQKAE